MFNMKFEIWGLELEIGVTFVCYKNETVLPSQIETLNNFLKTPDLLTDAKSKVAEFCLKDINYDIPSEGLVNKSSVQEVQDNIDIPSEGLVSKLSVQEVQDNIDIPSEGLVSKPSVQEVQDNIDIPSEGLVNKPSMQEVQDNIHQYVDPTCLRVLRPRDNSQEIAVLCEYKFDPEHGIAIVFKDNCFDSVVSQDEVL